MLVDRVWRFFCSVRAALYEIGFLALLILIGTLKGSVIPAQIPKLIPALEPVVVRWYAFDVFRSVIFSLTLGLLAIAVVVCTINRVPGIWAAIVHPTVRTTPSFFQRTEMAATLTTSDTPRQTGVKLEALFRARRYRVRLKQHDGATHLYADKHRFGRLGTFPFHLALIMVLVGGIVGSEYGFREMEFFVPEGSTREIGRGTGISVELVRFVDEYSEIGAPTEFRSDLVIYDRGREVKRQSISVNNPLTYDNVTIYQSAFGPAASIRVADANGATVFEDGIAFSYFSRANSSAPAALVDLPAQGVRFELIFPNVSLNDTPEIGDIKLLPGEMYVQARDWRTNALIGEGVVISQGESASISGLNLQFVRERRFSAMQVAYNPGVPILLAASVIGIAGLVVTFGLPHRRIRAIVTSSGDGSQVFVAPMARRDWSGKRDFVRVLAVIDREVGQVEPYGRSVYVVD